MFNNPIILSLATAVPAERYPQAEIFEYLSPLFERTRHARAVFSRAGVDYRHVVVDRDFYRQEQRTQARNEFYLQHALPLGEQALRRCLEQTGRTPDDITDFFVVSCTG